MLQKGPGAPLGSGRSLLLRLLWLMTLSITSVSAIGPKKDNSSVASVECGLRSDTIRFHLNKERGVFVQVESNIGSEDTTNSSATQSHNGTVTEDDVELARRCWCSQFHTDRSIEEYCPVNFDSCVVYSSPDAPAKCYRLSKQESVMQAIWPVVLFWYGLLAIALACSSRGRNARKYMRRKLRYCGNQERQEQDLYDSVNEMVTQRYWFPIVRLRQAAVLRRDWVLRLEETRGLVWLAPYFRIHDDEADLEAVLAMDEEPALPPMSTISLALKVKSYQDPLALHDAEQGHFTAREQSPQEQQRNGDDEDPSDYEDEHSRACAICLKVLIHGDSIGDIPCGHLFHKDCLKDWLKRKNSCPMCKQTEIAAIRTSEETAPKGTDTSFSTTASSSDDSNVGSPQRP